MGNQISKFTPPGDAENFQLLRVAPQMPTITMQLPIGALDLLHNPGKKPETFKSALMNVPLDIQKQWDPIASVGFALVFATFWNHSVGEGDDEAFWKHLVEQNAKQSFSSALDRTAALGFWIVEEEKDRKELYELLRRSGDRFHSTDIMEAVVDVLTQVSALRKSQNCAFDQCPKQGESLLKPVYCSGCRVVAYCSKACQTQAWPSHRNGCNNYKQFLATLSERAAMEEARERHDKKKQRGRQTQLPKTQL